MFDFHFMFDNETKYQGIISLTLKTLKLFWLFITCTKYLGSFPIYNDVRQNENPSEWIIKIKSREHIQKKEYGTCIEVSVIQASSENLTTYSGEIQRKEYSDFCKLRQSIQ